MDRSEVSLLVLLNLSKAFDSVNHYLLLNKSVQLNIDTTWFVSYLHERTDSVKIDKNLSNQRSIYMEYPMQAGINTRPNLYGVPH